MADKRLMDGSKALWHMDRVISHYDKDGRIAPVHIDWGLTKICMLPAPTPTKCSISSKMISGFL